MVIASSQAGCSRRTRVLTTFLARNFRRRRLVDLFAIIVITFVLLSLFRFADVHIGFSRPLSKPRSRYKLAGCEHVGKEDDETPISAHHNYSPSGLLHVNPDGIHPLLALIRSAEDEWDRKLDRASRTLEDAVREYKRRYRRDPPAGFDDWWDFAQEMEDQLPDEYDSIYREIEPFWGMDPTDLVNIQAAQELRTDTFTLSKNETHDTNLAATAFSDPEHWEQKNLLRGLSDVIALLDPVEPALRPFRAVFSPRQEPSLLSDYHIRKMFLDAAAARKYVNITNLPKAQNLGFASACPPGSPGSLSPSYRSAGRSFIHNHRLSMDPCQNPHLFDHHAHYVGQNLGPAPQPTLAAQFSYSNTPIYHDIQIPSLSGLVAEGPEDDVEWQNKTDDRLFWRGSSEGMVNSEKTQWRDAHRPRLVSWANALEGTANLLIPGRIEDEGWQRVGGGTLVQRVLVNPMLFDVAFEGKPVGCDVQFCRHMETQFEWRKLREQPTINMWNHKYILDVDGKGPSTDFKRLMSSNSLIFKATVYPEWWLDRSQPWVHYVPVQVDYSDLHDTLLFFRGGLYGEDNHEYLAKRIAHSGKEWSEIFWREEDMTVYLFRLMLEYSRVMSPDRDSMFYRPSKPPNG